MASNSSRSSYRNTFKNQTAYSTAGAKSFSRTYISEEPVVSQHVSYSYSSSGFGFPTGEAALEKDVMDLKLNEKETLSSINSRLATYIEKVRYLEEQNEKLEKQILEARTTRKESDFGEDKMATLRLLRAQVDEAKLAKIRSEVLRDSLKGEASEIRWKLDHEGRLRSDLDDELIRLRKDVDDATMVRVDLERKIEVLKEEVEYGVKVHDEEVEELKEQIKNQSTSVEVDGIAPDVTELLRQIRSQYEEIALKSKDEAEQWYKGKLEDLKERERLNLNDMESVQEEINDYRKQVTDLEMELESVRGTNEYLERSLADVERRYDVESSRYQERVAIISGELDKASAEMKRHLADYKQLMSVKLSLEKEIMTYRILLEGEEKRVDASSNDEKTSESDDDKSMTYNKTILVKTIETKDGKIVSSSVSEKEIAQVASGNLSSSSDEEST